MTFVYQAYGLKEILEQTLFSVVSLFKILPQDSPHKAMIYTDQPDYFKSFCKSFESRIEIVHQPMEQFQRWRGAIDFVHRVKLEVLRDAGKRFNGPLIYLDGDTYFLKDPSCFDQKINDENSLMHIAEAQLNEGRDPLTKKICKFAKKNQFELNGKLVPLRPQSTMWNAGVIGISHDNKKLLDDMIELTDKMFVVYPKHVIEQLAVSVILDWKTKLHATDDFIYHYWNQKPEYQEAIQSFFADNTNMQSAISNYDSFNKPAEKPTAKKSFFSQITRIFYN